MKFRVQCLPYHNYSLPPCSVKKGHWGFPWPSMGRGVLNFFKKNYIVFFFILKSSPIIRPLKMACNYEMNYLELATESENCWVVSNSLWPRGLYSPWNSPGQNTGVGSLSLLQGIFPTQESNPGLPHCRQILYQLNHKGYTLREP